MGWTVFVEGLPGSGKSVSANNLASGLANLGREVALFEETARGHPLHVGDLDEVGAAMPNIHLEFSPEQFAESALARYKTFADSPDAFRITIFESFPVQSHVRVLMQMGAPSDLIWSFWSRLQTVLASVNPALIYFETSAPDAALRSIMAKRGPEWTRYVVQSLEQTPYAAARELRGVEGILRMLQNYAVLMDQAVRQWQFPKLVLPSNPDSYAQRDQEMDTWLRRLLVSSGLDS
jgi:hypothetical protein